jgi:hypothetical protein
MSKDKAVQEELPEDKGPRMAKKVININPDAAVTVVSESNPKRAGSQAFEDWKIYDEANVTTVQEGFDAGLTKAHFAYDHMHGFIEVAGAEVVEYEVTPRGPNKDADTEAEEPVTDGEEVDNDGF